MSFPSKYTSITSKISQFVDETTVKNIPEGALKQACLAITDFIGVSLLGSRDELSKIIVGYVREMGGSPQASIIGSNLKTSPRLAALANGTMGHAQDYDDIGLSIGGHPSVAIVPAILAVGETMGASGKDIIAAYVVGYEAVSCIAVPLTQSHYVQGWHTTGTFGALGAVAAVTWLLKHAGVRQIKMALGIAVSLAGGVRQNFGTMTKPLHAGEAAANGVEASILAQKGFTANEAIIEAPLGFAKVFGYNKEVDWTKASENLGETFAITTVKGGLWFKAYPSCGSTHCAIDAALYIKRKYKVNVDDVVEVELGSHSLAKQILVYHRPNTGLEGKFSLEYTTARALISGKVLLEHFTDSAVNEDRVKSLIEKMKWVEKYPSPVFSEQGVGTSSVTVKLKDGREFSKEVTFSKGMTQNPLSLDELKSKYKDCASAVLTDKDIERSLSILTNLKEVKNIKEIMKIVAKEEI